MKRKPEKKFDNQFLAELMSKNPIEAVDIAQGLKETFRLMVDQGEGIKTPWWPKFMDAIGHLREHEYSIICGPTGSGKTEFLTNLSAQLLEQGVKHYVASVETGYHDYLKRIMSPFCKKSLNTYNTFSLEECKKLYDLMLPYMKNDTIFFGKYEQRIPLEVLETQLLYHAQVKGCKLAILDNLNFFLDLTTADQQNIEMDRVTQNLILMCKQIPMHIIMVMHPRKTDGGRVLSEFDIKGSSTTVQLAHNIMLFNRVDDKEFRDLTQVPDTEDTRNFREIKFAKIRRRGANVGRKIFFRFHEARFKELRDSSQPGKLRAFD